MVDEFALELTHAVAHADLASAVGFEAAAAVMGDVGRRTSARDALAGLLEVVAVLGSGRGLEGEREEDEVRLLGLVSTSLQGMRYILGFISVLWDESGIAIIRQCRRSEETPLEYVPV